METGVGFETSWIGLEAAATGHQHRLQSIETGEGAVDHRFIDQWPEPFGRLQFGGGSRQEDQVDACRHGQVERDMPPGAIDDEHRAMLIVDRLVTGEGGQGQGHRLGASRGQQAPPTPAAAGTHEAVDVEPLVVALDPGERPLPLRCPDPPQDRQQSEAMLILRP